MAVADVMREKLAAAFAPVELDVRDDSEKHRGHGGWREGGETHFHVRIVSPAFDGMSRVARSRAVHAALKAELDGGVHALGLDLRGASEV
ncbi:MAG: BolA family protein [Rubrimonas sp.]|uniref:BolA family protein n=1 Tax=Rubrimonas sp. TaxID=2036015 RepID=UPI002FDE30FE